MEFFVPLENFALIWRSILKKINSYILYIDMFKGIKTTLFEFTWRFIKPVNIWPFFLTEEYQSDAINTNGVSHFLGFNQIILRDFQKGFNNSYTLLSIFISSLNRWNIAEDRTINRNKIKLENHGGLCQTENLKSCCVVTHEHMRIKATDVSSDEWHLL